MDPEQIEQELKDLQEQEANQEEAEAEPESPEQE